MKRKLMRGAAVPALALGLLGGVLAGGGRPAAAGTLIQNCPFTANLPGDYVLVRDLTCSAFRAITVAANNVTLVLAGHTLTAVPFAGIEGVGARNVTGLAIVGGTIVGFRNGDIILENAPNARVISVTATGSELAGIIVLNTTGALLSGNTVTNNGRGIALNGATGALLTGNTVRNNDRGIDLFFSANSNRVVGNTATGNGTQGILAQPGVTGNQFLGNTATGNSPDLEDANLPACINTWRSNTFVTDNESNGPGAGCIR